ncbi:MAG: hypothetical protein D6730_07205 [Bacteroidetes bacterium]|nr:MAG: hypothetical protein D6730_07205 [Bacteroidota bacterium]
MLIKLTLSLLILLPGLGLCMQGLHAQSLLIRNVRIVDVEKGRVLPPCDILIDQGRISGITQVGAIRLMPHVKIYQAGGKYIIPGLWDMHTHPDDPELWRMKPDAKSRDLLLPQFVMHGVTGTRDMAGSLEVVKDWKRRIQSGELIGPEIFAAGPLLDGPNPMWDGSVGIASPQRVQPVVDSLIREGVDFLKVYSLLPRDIYFALSKYANQIDFPFCGHVPNEVSCAEAAQSGMKSQEHLLGILLDCSSRSEEVRANKVDFGQAKGLDRYVLRQQLLLDTYDPQKAQQLFQTFVKYGSWHTPTLSMWYKNAWFEREVEKDRELYAYLPEYMRRYWTPEENDHLRYRDHQGFIQMKQQLYRKYEELVKAMHQAGVPLLAGTDMGANPLCFPGIGLHNELSCLVAAGLSPAEALKTATLNPAIYLGIEKDYGTVAEGKVADLVILEENPLEDIAHIREIRAVFKNGKLYDEQARARILDEIAAKLK